MAESLRMMGERILLLDGAMGTELQRRGHFGNPESLVLSHPKVIADVHREYLEAGADVIETCTFNAQRISQADYGYQDRIREINLNAARIARREADRMTEATPQRPRMVVGSVGPTTKMLSIDAQNHALSFDDLEDAYYEQISALIEGGVDGILLETIIDTLNAKAAISAYIKAKTHLNSNVELLISMTLSDASGRLLSGQSIEAFVNSVMHAAPVSIGLNCSFGAHAMLPYLRELSKVCPVNVTVHPNAGLPDENGNYNDSPEIMATEIRAFLDEGLVNMIGGCCGTTPSHIRTFRTMIDEGDFSARATPSMPDSLRLSGLDVLNATQEFVNIGERCNVAGSRKFLRLINEKKYDEALEIARSQVEDGAMMLDINMDDGLLDSKAEMVTFLNLIGQSPDICKVPIMIDSSDFEVIESALKSIQGKSIVNSISLKDGEDAFLRKASVIKRYGAAVVIMAFDEEGQATSFKRKIEIARRSYNLLVGRAGFNPSDIIFDPAILTVATGMSEHLLYALDFVRATEWIHDNLPGARVSGGVSNLSFAFRGNNYLRNAMHAVFLYHAIKRGLNMAIMNPGVTLTYDDIPETLRSAIEDVLFNKCDEDATKRLVELASESVQADTRNTPYSSTSPIEEPDVEQRLIHAMIAGDVRHLAEDLDSALQSLGSAMAIIAGPLMEGMNEVGKRFREGKMFLPQVVRTARTMNVAVEHLTPYILSDKADSNADISYTGRILLATVRGDVHDIGKNIVGVIMKCNNFDVIDLGVMVAPESIVNAAKEYSPDIIGLSGLISPSLEAMADTLKLLEKSGIRVPILIGGATTSATHTAVALAPLYSGPVVHVRDAAYDPVVSSILIDSSKRDDYIRKLQDEQLSLVGKKSNPSNEKDNTPFENKFSHTPKPADAFKNVGKITTENLAISDLRDNIDWRYFYHAWKVTGKANQIEILRQDADNVLDEICSNPSYYVKSLLGYFNAKSEADCIAFTKGADEIRVSTPRQSQGERLSLCDFVSTVRDTVGVFAVTMSDAFTRKLESLKSGTDTYTAMLWQTIADRLAEAAAGVIHDKECKSVGLKGIRPAIGYPSLPDQKEIFTLDKICGGLSKIGISLTETGAMYPQASIAGFLIFHDNAKYFAI